MMTTHDSILPYNLLTNYSDVHINLPKNKNMTTCKNKLYTEACNVHELNIFFNFKKISIL